MKVGDIVKSHDFCGRADCYYIGEVVGLEDWGFKALAIKRVLKGKAVKIELGVNDYFTAPFNGNSFEDDFAPAGFVRVEVLG